MNYKRYLPFLLAFVLPLVLVYAWWGGFNPVSVRVETRGPYTYAYVEHTGDYAKLADRLPEVRRGLERSGIQPGAAFAVLYSHPDQVPRNERQARIGYLVPAGSPAPQPLKIDTIPARRVLVAEVRAAWLLGPSRAYQALHDALLAEGRAIHMPTVELYEASGSLWRQGRLTVEVPYP